MYGNVLQMQMFVWNKKASLWKVYVCLFSFYFEKFVHEALRSFDSKNNIFAVVLAIKYYWSIFRVVSWETSCWSWKGRKNMVFIKGFLKLNLPWGCSQMTSYNKGMFTYDVIFQLGEGKPNTTNRTPSSGKPFNYMTRGGG